MTFKAGQGLSASVIALAVGLALLGVARAQDEGPPANAGILTGEVARCLNGAEMPAANVAVGVDGGPARLGMTNANGEFFFAVPAGQYTVIASADDGTNASRQYVPVTGGEVLDIGVLDLGGGAAGCAPDADVTAPVLPTFTATPLATAVPPTATPAAEALPTATPMPVEAPADLPAPDDAPPEETGSAG
jgi:hypothetical protein